MRSPMEARRWSSLASLFAGELGKVGKHPTRRLAKVIARFGLRSYLDEHPTELLALLFVGVPSGSSISHPTRLLYVFQPVGFVRMRMR